MIEVSGREVGRGTLYRNSQSSVGFDYAKRFEDCHCEGEARSNLQLTKTEIASSFHSSQ